MKYILFKLTVFILIIKTYNIHEKTLFLTGSFHFIAWVITKQYQKKLSVVVNLFVFA